MSDIQFLPRNYLRAMRRAAIASDAIRNMLLVYHPNYETVWDPFLGDLIRDEYAAAKTNGTSAAVSVASSQLTLTTGTDSDGYAGQGYGLFWTGDNGYYMESAQAINSVADDKFEVGVTDVTSDAGAINAKATPTFTATDCAILVLDSTDNAEFDLLSQDTSGGAANVEDVYTVVGGTIFRTEFVGQNDKVAVFVNGNHAGADANCQGGVSITPWWFAQTRTTSSKVATIEYVFMTGPNGLAIP